MTFKELLIQEIDNIPDPLIREVLDFLHFLKAKQEQDNEDLQDARTARSTVASPNSVLCTLRSNTSLFMSYYCNQIALFFIPFLVTLSPFILSESIAAQGTNSNDGKVALNSVAICKKNASSFLREDKSRLLVISSKCAQLTHAVLAALRDAKYKPQNLRNKGDLEQFMEGAAPIIGQNREVNRVYTNLLKFYPSSVLGEIMQGSTAAYLLLDYGIDPRKLLDS